VVAGFGLFFVLRPPIASIPWTGAPFFASNLRLSLADLGLVAVGVPVAVVALESAVPLVVIAVVSAGAGFLAAALFLHAQPGYSLVAPQAAYYGIALAGLALSLAIIAATFPLLSRITGPDVARNE
jgi:hypothetical protein